MTQKTHRAVEYTSSAAPLTVKDVPTPRAGPGSAVVQVLAVPIISYMSDVLSGKRQYPMSVPLAPGTSAIGRVTTTGPDAVALTPGTLVLCDIFVSARDEPGSAFLMGLHSGSPRTRLLMDGEWRHGTWAEYAKFPLENLFPLNEDLLLKVQGYSINDLCTLATAIVPYGGLDEIGLKAGETVVIAPATGQFGGAAVGVALAMGANVIAMGRNKDTLGRLTDTYGSTRLTTVTMTSSLEGDMSALRAVSPAGFSAYLDLTPPEAAGNTYMQAAISSLKYGGRVALMGGGMDVKMTLSPLEMVLKSLKLYGKWMYSREQALRGIQLAEVGLLQLGEKAGVVTKGVFGLDEIQVAVDKALEEGRWGSQVLVHPGL